jgi:hypothetical protein
MEKLIIEGTRKTPSVNLNPSGLLRIEGRSIPEDTRIFYKSIKLWIEEYLRSPAELTTFDIAFEYLNSGTSKYMVEILTLLRELVQNGHKLKINWYYEDGDDDILERGEYFSSILDLPISLIETE